MVSLTDLTDLFLTWVDWYLCVTTTTTKDTPLVDGVPFMLCRIWSFVWGQETVTRAPVMAEFTQDVVLDTEQNFMGYKFNVTVALKLNDSSEETTCYKLQKVNW